MSADEDYYEEEEETKLLNAEEVTMIATDFLRRLGHKQGLKPVKASLEDEVYVVEVGLVRKTATVQIDATTEQIKEYEIKEKQQDTQTSSLISLNPKNILILACTAFVSFAITAVLGISF